MTQFRNELIERIVHIYGFEHEVTIFFIKLCEKYENNEFNDKCLETFVEAHEAEPIMDEE